MDGVGEWTTTSFGVGHDNLVEIDSEIHFPAFPGSAVFRFYLLHRIQGQFR